MQENIKFCPDCGNELSADSKFCSSCGKKIEQEAGQAPRKQAPIQPPNIPAKPASAISSSGPGLVIKWASIGLVGATVIVIILSHIFIKDDKASPADKNGKPLSKETLALLGIAKSVMAFRNDAIKDPDKAFKDYCTGQAKTKLAALNSRIWTTVSPATGWAWLLNTSPFAIGGSQTEHPLGCFYNPFSDMALLLEWGNNNGTYRISDMELMPADCLRKSGKPPFDTAPAWIRPDILPAEALARAFVVTMRSFESMFPQDKPTKSWRTRCLPEDNSAMENIIYPAVSLAAGKQLLSMSEFLVQEPDESKSITAVRNSMTVLLNKAKNGQIARVLAEATATSAACANAIKLADAKAFSSLAVVSMAIGEKNAYVFTVNPASADFSLCFSFRFRSGKADLDRLDLIHYPSIYRASQKH